MRSVHKKFIENLRYEIHDISEMKISYDIKESVKLNEEQWKKHLRNISLMNVFTSSWVMVIGAIVSCLFMTAGIRNLNIPSDGGVLMFFVGFVFAIILVGQIVPDFERMIYSDKVLKRRMENAESN